MSGWQRFDEDLSQRARKLTCSSASYASAWLLAHSGDSQWWLAAGALLWWLGNGGGREAGIRIIAVTVVAGVASSVLKLSIRRPRPVGGTGFWFFSFDRHAFPSGHATRLGGLVVVLGATFPLAGIVALVVWALAVGLGRVALGVHYVSDIVAGLLVGALVGMLLLVFLQ